MFPPGLINNGGGSNRGGTMVCWINFGAKNFQGFPKRAKSNQIKPNQAKSSQQKQQRIPMTFCCNLKFFHRKSTNNNRNKTEPNDSKQLFRILGARPEHSDTLLSKRRATAYQNWCLQFVIGLLMRRQCNQRKETPNWPEMPGLQEKVEWQEMPR